MSQLFSLVIMRHVNSDTHINTQINSIMLRVIVIVLFNRLIIRWDKLANELCLFLLHVSVFAILFHCLSLLSQRQTKM